MLAVCIIHNSLTHSFFLHSTISLLLPIKRFHSIRFILIGFFLDKAKIRLVINRSTSFIPNVLYKNAIYIKSNRYESRLHWLIALTCKKKKKKTNKKHTIFFCFVLTYLRMWISESLLDSSIQWMSPLRPMLMFFFFAFAYL